MLKAGNLELWLAPVRMAGIGTDVFFRIGWEDSGLEFIFSLISPVGAGLSVNLRGSVRGVGQLRPCCLSVHLYKVCNKL